MTDNQIYKLIIDSDHDDPSHDEGVITLADSSFFAGFVLLYESIQISEIKIVVKQALQASIRRVTRRASTLSFHSESNTHAVVLARQPGR